MLQTICGVNEYVSGPVGTIAKCYRSHVNFLAIPNCPQFPAIRKPMLFFAEVSNDDKDTAGTQPFCCLVVPLPCAGISLPFSMVLISHLSKHVKGHPSCIFWSVIKLPINQIPVTFGCCLLFTVKDKNVQGKR